jgi:hypothetical protein
MLLLRLTLDLKRLAFMSWKCHRCNGAEWRKLVVKGREPGFESTSWMESFMPCAADGLLPGKPRAGHDGDPDQHISDGPEFGHVHALRVRSAVGSKSGSRVFGDGAGDGLQSAKTSRGLMGPVV